MKKVFFGLFFALSTIILATPFFAFAAPALDSIPDAVKSKYTFNGVINSVVATGTKLYIGGSFTTVTQNPLGEPIEFERNNLAAIDLTTYTLTSFDPNIAGEVKALELSADGSTLYVGGNFLCVGGLDIDLNCIGDVRNYLAAIDTRDGTALPAFSPEPDSPVNALELNSDDSVLYAGGGFYVGDAEYAAAYTTADNTATAFDPGFDNEVTDVVLSPDDAILYVLGYFELVNDVIPQQYIAALDATSGTTTDFNAALDGLGVNTLSNGLALSSDGATLYVGGSFDTTFFQASGEGVVFDETTQTPAATFPRISTSVGGGGATVYTATSDGSGGWFIGGSFTHVNGVAREGLAHINADGTLDAGWDAGIDNNNAIYALELSPGGTVLYAGGNFLEGSEQYLAAFSAEDGTVTAFHPYPGGPVYDLELSADGETLYVGGSFASVTEAFTARPNIAAFDTTGVGTLLPFDPQTCDQVKALQLTNDGGTLYMGGDFTCVNSDTTADTRNRIAAFATAGAGTLVAGFDPNANGTVEDLLLAPDETTIYTGGAFTTIGGASRNQFAEITLADGTATALDAGIAGTPETVYTVALSSDESTIYIGGDSELTTIGGQPRRYFGEINATTGAVTDFYPAFNGNVHVVVASGGDVFIGGSFIGINATNVSNLIAVDTSDSSLITAFAPAVNNMVRTLSLSSDDTLLYAGGDFTDVNSGTARSYLAAFDTTDGDAAVFDPTGEVLYGYATALKGDDTELYFGSYDFDDTGNSELLIFDTGEEVASTATLTVSKVVVNDDGGTSVAGDFSLTLDGLAITSGVATTTAAGTYTVDETGPAGYTGTFSGDCASDGTITMIAGNTYTCTLTNDDNAIDGGDGAGGGGGTSYRRDLNPLEQNRIQELMSQVIVLLRELIQKLIEEQQN